MRKARFWTTAIFGFAMLGSLSACDDHDCADVPGTVVKEVSRFIGDSGAAASTARACIPDEKTSEPEPPPTEPTGGSCVGACDSADPIPNGDGTSCYCDSGCAEFGDCCSDRQTVCG